MPSLYEINHTNLSIHRFDYARETSKFWVLANGTRQSKDLLPGRSRFTTWGLAMAALQRRSIAQAERYESQARSLRRQAEALKLVPAGSLSLLVDAMPDAAIDILRGD